MCGIAGFCLDKKHAKRINTSDLSAQLLLDIEHRGTDATGIAFVSTKTGKRVLVKSPISATEFINKNLNRCRYATTAITHTRYATQGSPTNSNNNHPISRGNITLTHNGHCTNDNELFKQLGCSRIGKVDSEAIVALIAYGKGSIISKLEMIEGNAALAWIDNKNPNTLHLARVRTSPLWIGQSREGSVIYGSTKQTVTNGAIVAECELDWLYEMQEGEYFRIVDGVIVEKLSFTPMEKPVVYKHKDQYTYDYKYDYKYDKYYSKAWDLDDYYYQTDYEKGKKKDKPPF